MYVASSTLEDITEKHCLYRSYQNLSLYPDNGFNGFFIIFKRKRLLFCLLVTKVACMYKYNILILVHLALSLSQTKCFLFFFFHFLMFFCVLGICNKESFSILFFFPCTLVVSYHLKTEVMLSHED